MKTKLSFVIPCYRSENTITAVVDEIRNTVKTRSDSYDYEIILVSDYSPDNVFDVIKELSSNDKKIMGLELAKNFGQHAAILAGFHYVTGDIVVCLDDDGQTPPNQMFRLIDTLGDDCDVAFARYSEKKHSHFRNIGSMINDVMARYMIDKPKELKIMSYFACKRYVADEVIHYNNPYPYMSGLLLRTTKKIKNVTIKHRDRIEGESGYKFGKLLALWINGFTSFSIKPLRAATFVGIFSALAGFLYGVYIVINKLINPLTPLGYSSMMAVFLFIGGMIMKTDERLLKKDEYQKPDLPSRDTSDLCGSQRNVKACIGTGISVDEVYPDVRRGCNAACGLCRFMAAGTQKASAYHGFRKQIGSNDLGNDNRCGHVA